QQAPIVVGLVVVHVHAVPMHVPSQAVTGAVQDPLAVALALEHVPRRAIALPPAQLMPRTGRILDEPHRGIACLGDRAESPSRLFRNTRGRDPYPGDVSKHRAGIGPLAPEVE